ncbi:MAG: exodeoxyribonuclease V subunit alpha [Ilumatobacteraceae bacterium]
MALGVGGVLGAFNAAGVLHAADVHVARRLGALTGEDHESVLLAAAFAVRAPRQAHVCVDLADLAETATSDLDEDADLSALPWPDLDGWLDRLRTSALVADGDGPAQRLPLRLDGTRLYLDRYWRQERAIADALVAAGATPPTVDEALLADGLDRLFGNRPDDLQRAAAAAAVRCSFAVVAGGPGTGKTTTVARIVALLDEQAAHAGDRLPRVALAAPTGKAAARLEEAVQDEAGRLPVGDGARRRLAGLRAVTLHRLLGWRPGSRSRFRHDRTNRLPFDVVVVDETSMVSTSLMAKLVEALAPGARLILVGDPDQLASIEAGAVLGDIVGPAGEPGTAVTSPVAGGIVVLRAVHRFGGAIAELAAAIRAGDEEATLERLRAAGSDGDTAIEWLDGEPDAAAALLAPVRDAATAAGSRLTDAARAGDADAALTALGELRILCAHRHGPAGASTWTALVEQWLADGATAGPWYVGRPLLVTENDYGLQLYNGDTGVVVRTPDGIAAAFRRGHDVAWLSPRRLASVETVYAMTVHKSQGSQFATVAVVLPEPTSPVLTRELLYTAVTRAQQRLIVAGTEASVRAAVRRPITRATGLRTRLWPVSRT